MPAIIAALILSFSPSALRAAASQNQQSADVALLSEDELFDLVGPIALYPDELLAIVLPGSTYPVDIVKAARYLAKYEKDNSLKPDERWDSSVLGLLNYPEVIKMMNEDLDWTWQLGEAVANQQEDVMDAVQAFRQKAEEAGNLKSNAQLTVVHEKKIIEIRSTSTEVIYVPTYNPSTVVVYTTYPYPWIYSPPYPYYHRPAAAFWTGMFVGAAIRYGVGWRGRGHSSINVNVNTGGRGGGGGRKKWTSRGGGNVGRPGGSPRAGGRAGGSPRASGRAGGSRPGASTGGRSTASTGRSGGSRAAYQSRSTASKQRSSNRRYGSGASQKSRQSGRSGGSFGSYNRGQQATRDSRRGQQSRASRSNTRSSRKSGGGGRRRGGGGRR